MHTYSHMCAHTTIPHVQRNNYVRSLCFHPVILHCDFDTENKILLLIFSSSLCHFGQTLLQTGLSHLEYEVLRNHSGSLFGPKNVLHLQQECSLARDIFKVI